MELLIKERQPFAGIKKMANLFITLLFGKIEEQKIIVKKSKIKKKNWFIFRSYFSATKVKWIIDNVPKAKKLLRKNQLLFGTIDSFLIWKLTEGKIHATDATNASRTMLFNIVDNRWDKEILKIFKLNKKILPIVKNSADNYGFTSKNIIGQNIPITGVLGDQQASMIGQACFEKGAVKSTYGTGAFVLMNTGDERLFSKQIQYQLLRIKNKTTYALEDSMFIAGAGVQWLRDKIKLINNASETEKITKSKNNNKGVCCANVTGWGTILELNQGV